MTEPQEALHILLQLTRRLTEELKLEDALQAVTDSALELLPANHASVRLLDETRAHLLCGARSGVGTELKPMSFGLGEGVIGWVVEKEIVAHVEDTAQDPRYLRRDGQPFPVRSILAVPLWSAGHVVGVLAVSSDSPKVFAAQDELLTRLLANCAVPSFEKARLERLAITDAHTLAFNRRYLVPRLEEEMSRAGRTGANLSLLLLDLDHFKRVNDEHGHGEGDRVLRGFADRVRLETRRQDALVRWGGEEFVLIMPDTDTDMARHVAERIRQAVANRPFNLADGVRLRQTVSIGVATWNSKESPKELESRADAAMYQAKEDGRNRVQVAKSPTIRA